MPSLDKRALYRFPWSPSDNPFGWLEVTDRCNVSCPGCYRQSLEGDLPLEEIRRQLQILRSRRNCRHVSIAGGEPLLHPEIVDVISCAHELSMKPLLLTNGRALTSQLLQGMKRAGLFGVAFHVDKMQKRQPEWNNKSEAELNELRQHYVDMVHDAGGLYCSIGLTVFRSNLAEISEVIRWANENIDRVHGLRFTIFRAASTDPDIEYLTPEGERLEAKDLCYSSRQEVEEDIGLTSQDLWQFIRSAFPHYDASGYLGGTADHTSIKWLIGTQIGSRQAMYGSVGARTMELFQVLHHFVHGTYPAYASNNRCGLKSFLLGIADPQVRAAFRVFLRGVLRHPVHLVQPIYLQGVGILQGPDITEHGQPDMCESCPDMTVYNGQLVPCCRLDEVRTHGGLLTPMKVLGAQHRTLPLTPTRAICPHRDLLMCGGTCNARQPLT